MFGKSLIGSKLPVQNNQYYVTVKFLKKLTNGDTVELDQLVCSTGKILKLAGKDEKDVSKLYLGSTNAEIFLFFPFRAWTTAKTSAPSFKNLGATSSKPVLLFTLRLVS